MHRRLLQLARSAPLPLALTIACGLLAGLLTIFQAWLVSSTVDAVFLGGRTLPQVMGWMELILLAIAARSALAWLGETAACAVAVPIKNSLRTRLVSHILDLGPAASPAASTGELATAAVEGVEALDAYYRQYLPQLVVSTLVPLSILAIVFPRDPLAGVLLLLTAPLIPFFMVMIGRSAEAATGRRYDTLSRMSSYFLDSLQGLTTLKVFGQSRAQAANIASVSDQFRDATLKVLQVTFLSALALELLATLSTAIIAVEVGLRLLYARMEFREALFILILAPEFYLPLRTLGLRFHAGMSGVKAARRIFQVLDTPLPVRPAVSDSPFSVPGSFRLELQDVAYTYPGAGAPALDGISFSIEPGQQVALVGRSGAGKTTLINLLLRFMDPNRGCILVDGRPLSEIPIDRWREMIAWVPQAPHLFDGTIASNIRLGRPLASEEQVIQAARLAHLHEFVKSLPDRYETHIGEGGTRLSSGQAQRLALARAFLKEAPLLLMDEPTSSLDPETESLLEDATRRLMQGRAVLTIAHRLNTVFRADQILVLEGGRLIESGTHGDLLERRSGTYAALAAPYRAVGSGVRSQFLLHAAPVPPAIIEPLPVVSSLPPSSGRGAIGSRLLGFLRGSWGRAGLSVLLSALTIGASVALMGTSAWMISMAALHPSIAALGVSVVGVRFFGIARGVFRYLERLVSHDVTFRLLARLRVWFYERLEPLAPARLIDFQLGDLLARIVSDVETLENFYVRVIAPPLAAVVVAAAVSLFLARWDARLVLILLASYLLLGFLVPLWMGRLSQGPGVDLIAQRSRLHARLVDGIQGLADLLVFGRGPAMLEDIKEIGRAYGQAERRMAWLGGLEVGLVVLVSNAALWSVLLVCIPRVSGGTLHGTMLAALALLVMASFEAVLPLPAAARTWSTSREAARRLFEVVDASPAVVDRRGSQGESLLPSRAGLPSLEVRDLSFTYPGRTQPALDGVSFHLEPGGSLAIIGPSGAGKSTLAWLLLRFWDYDSGEILLAGRSIHDYTQEAVRSQIGFLSPHDHIFNTTLRENLRMARRGLSSAEIEAAAARARLHDAVLRMPGSYEALVGERGARLSGGERQRMAIARVLLKDAPLLLLDEPTANLDPLTEAAVLETLFELIRSRTALLITHRLVGLEHVDGILVMNHGRIVERGTHASLLREDGLYRRLWDLQNRRLAEAPPFGP